LKLEAVAVRLVNRPEEVRYRELLDAHHYLGSLPKIGETLWYVATHGDDWVALLSFSAAALKCGVRDRWIGWDFRFQYDRLRFLANNSRFLILPDWHFPNLGSKVLSLCTRRIAADWQARFGHPLAMLETFVDPERFHGTVYQAANWTYVGNSRGFSRTRAGYDAAPTSPKKVFVKVLDSDARALLSQPVLAPRYLIGVPKMTLSAEQTLSLVDFFKDVPDPRRGQGLRHRLPSILALAAAATLAGMRGYRAISDWVDHLGQPALARFRCRRENGKYVAPSLTTIRDALVRVDPVPVDGALQRFHAACGHADSALAIDGKTMCNAIDDQGRQTHIMSVVGHETGLCYTQKKLANCL
jgi:hypothetical protein